MAITLRVLGQLYPSAATETTLYTCATTSAVISSLVICNQSASTADTFTVRICVAGAGDSTQQVIFSNANIPPNTMVPLTAGLSLANTDVIKVTSTNGTCSFNLFGQENS